MTHHLPALLIVIPLMSAPVCLLLRRPRLVMGFTIAVTWAVFGVAVALLLETLDRGVIDYALGGWKPPWGIEYRVDTLSGFMAFLVSLIGAVVATWSPRSLSKEIPADRQYLFLSAYLLCLTGLLGITITGDLFNVFVFLEISAISSYALISMGRDRRALSAAFQYLILGTIGASFILIGIGLMYMMTGTLNMADMAERIGPVAQTRTILAAFGFLSVGLFLKVALFPLHGWLPNAYSYAPSSVTAFLAATATKVSLYILLRFVFSVFGSDFAFGGVPLGSVLMPLALVGIFVASTVAIFQRDIKRMLAYSSVAQIGYMVLGLGLDSVNGLTGGIVHMFNHALTKGGLFLAMGCIAWRVGGVCLDDMRGLGRQMPLTMFAWLLGGLGLIGVPLTSGFVSKWYLVTAALEKGWWPVAAMMLISSLLAMVYIWRVVEVAYFQERSPILEVATDPPLSLLLPTWLLIGASLVFGVWTPYSAGVARQAATILLGGTP